MQSDLLSEHIAKTEMMSPQSFYNESVNNHSSKITYLRWTVPDLLVDGLHFRVMRQHELERFWHRRHGSSRGSDERPHAFQSRQVERWIVLRETLDNEIQIVLQLLVLFSLKRERCLLNATGVMLTISCFSSR